MGDKEGATEKFWSPMKISTGRQQPGDGPAQGEMRAPHGHPGFKAVQGEIAKHNNPKTGKAYGPETAGKILGAASRGASPAAKKANPNLKKVKGS